MDDGPAKFVRLNDGRRIAYRELGCPQSASPLRSIIALHGLMSSRFGGMPGVREAVLVEYGVRLIAIDRPGYGESDPHPSQTFRSACKDIVAVADALHLGKRFWLHGYSMGGAFCWAAARYIPDRVEGIAMWCPVGNMWWKGISKEERKTMLSCYSTMDMILTFLCKLSPFLFIKWYSRLSCAFMDPAVDLTAGLSEADKKCMLQPGSAELMYRDRYESVKKNKGLGMAKDFELMNKGWDFEIAEVGEMFKRRIHVWQGEEDKLVPVSLQRWIQKQLPGTVKLHELYGEGHISLFVSTNLDRLTLQALFGSGKQGTSSPQTDTFLASYPANFLSSNGML
ncbi:hypothetical protein L7F22_041915 [Adiantum nelumboides]|nr:hypothetical protein [Adiantum nelumboides]